MNPIRADRVADFEFIIARLREALAKSTDPVRQAQGKSLRVFRAMEPGPANSVLFVFVIDPPVKGADYTVSRMLAEAFPSETEALWAKLRDAFAGGMYRVTLHAVPDATATPASAAAPGPPTAGASAPVPVQPK
ncbi:MAG: hypothetical protein AB7I50_06620 [Vicinamibacterales bacterium]